MEKSYAAGAPTSLRLHENGMELRFPKVKNAEDCVQGDGTGKSGQTEVAGPETDGPTIRDQKEGKRLRRNNIFLSISCFLIPKYGME